MVHTVLAENRKASVSVMAEAVFFLRSAPPPVTSTMLFCYQASLSLGREAI